MKSQAKAKRAKPQDQCQTCGCPLGINAKGEVDHNISGFQGPPEQARTIIFVIHAYHKRREFDRMVGLDKSSANVVS